MSGKKCLRVAQIVSQRLQCISREIILVKQNMVVCWATRSLSQDDRTNTKQSFHYTSDMIEHPFT